MALNAYTIYGNPLPDQTHSVDHLPIHELNGDELALEGSPKQSAKQSTMYFVPAQGDYDELGRPRNRIDSFGLSSGKITTAKGLGDWYSSLRRTHTDPPRQREAKGITTTTKLYTKETDNASNPPTPSTVAGPSKIHERPNWFKSIPNPNAAANNTEKATLADMLRRDPPNPAKPMIPPVYYAIGPTNRGYEMLSRGGWKEGQPLGRRRGIGSRPDEGTKVRSPSPSSSSEEEKWEKLGGPMPKLLRPTGTGNKFDVIDLTKEDEDEDEDKEPKYDENGKLFSALHASDAPTPFTPPNSLVSRERMPSQDGDEDESDTLEQDKPLLTPVAVALKNDRTGLGHTKKRRLVTHSSLAIHHHIQQGRTERRHQVSELRRMEREHRRSEYGRGKRAYARMAKEEALKRKRMMEYMGRD